jgi:hypothetical protein
VVKRKDNTWSNARAVEIARRSRIAPRMQFRLGGLPLAALPFERRYEALAYEVGHELRSVARRPLHCVLPLGDPPVVIVF